MPTGAAPDPADVVDRETFAKKLRELMEWADRTPDGIGRNGRGLIAKSTVHNIIKGATAVREDTLRKFLEACGLAGADQEPWVARRAVLFPEAKAAEVSGPAVLGPGVPWAEGDPISLGIRPVLPVDGFDALTPYVLRGHDFRLRSSLDDALAGRSLVITLVGGPATGKTRAAYEAARHLAAARPGRWRLWHPYHPTRAEAIVAGLGRVSPHTIVWLDEAHRYLAPAGEGFGERIAAGLRALLGAAERGPVVVLATMPLASWTALTEHPAHDEPDPYEQARSLFAGTATIVPPVFLPHDPQDGDTAADPRLREALQHAEGGRVVQYLAAGPALANRYELAAADRPGARAVLDVAMDARRYGHPAEIPEALLEKGVPGYLDDLDWDLLEDDWFPAALAWAAKPCGSGRGPLTPVRPRVPGSPHPPRRRLADLLEQWGRQRRAGVFPPGSFWDAVASVVTGTDVLRGLGRQAEVRGRYQRAGQLYRRAAELGDPEGLADLVRLLIQAGELARARELSALAVELGRTDVLADLAEAQERAGDPDGAAVSARLSADYGDVSALERIALVRVEAGDRTAAEAYAVEAAQRGDTSVLHAVMDARTSSNDLDGAAGLAMQAAEYGDFSALRVVAMHYEKNLDTEGVVRMFRFGTERGDADSLVALVRTLRQGDGAPEVAALIAQGIERGLTELLVDAAAEADGAGDQATALALAREAAECGHPVALWQLGESRKRVGEVEQARALYQEAYDRGHLWASYSLAVLAVAEGAAATATGLAIRDFEQGQHHTLQMVVQSFAADEYDRAFALARYAAALGRRGPLSWLASTCREREEWDKARAVVAFAVRHGLPGQARSLTRRLLEAGDVAAAAEVAEDAAPYDHADALCWLAMQTERGDPAEVDEQYARLAERGSYRALWRLIARHDRRGARRAAGDLALGLVDKGSDGAAQELAGRWMRSGDQANAERLLVKALRRGATGLLGDLARVRNLAGDPAGALDAAVQAAECGNTSVLLELADDGSREAAVVADALGFPDPLLRLAFDSGPGESLSFVDAGVETAMEFLAAALEWRGDEAGADNLRRYGLTDAGEIATTREPPALA